MVNLTSSSWNGLYSHNFENTHCNYYIENIFVKIISSIQKGKQALSMLHIDIKICKSTLMNSNNSSVY